MRAAVGLALLFPALASAQTVDSVVLANAGGCTTAGVEGLSRQLVDAHLCEFPGVVAEFAPHPGITLTSSRVHALATEQTVSALHEASSSQTLSVTSAFRTLVDQYVLFEEGGCGAAARPGSSNHQSGLAVDLRNWSEARAAMLAAGCSHPLPDSDPVHFDCPGPDMRSTSVLIFQRLWNLNHPEDRLVEDGLYGPQTGGRMGRSPASGFASTLCGVRPDVYGAELVNTSFPLSTERELTLTAGEERAGFLVLRNIGSVAWSSDTALATTQPRDHASPLAARDWLTPNRPARVEGTVAPGSTYEFAFSLRAPTEPGDWCVGLTLVQEGSAWFSDPGQLGPADDALSLCVRVEDPQPLDAAMPYAEDAGSDGRRLPGTGAGCACRAAARDGRTPQSVFLTLSALLALTFRRRVRGR